MKGYEQYGNHGEIVNKHDEVVGYYKTIGYDRLVVRISGKEFQWTHKKLEQELDNLNLNMIPIHD